MMPGNAFWPARIASSKLCRSSCLTLRCWCPLARSCPSVLAFGGAEAGSCPESGGCEVVGCTIRHYVDARLDRTLGGWRMEETRPALAIDIGGTKLAAGLVEPGGRVVGWAHVPTPVGVDAEQLWRTLD